MKNVKSDTRLRKEQSIYRWVKWGGYFLRLSTHIRIRFLLSEEARPTPMIPPFIEKFITLGQVANLLPLSKQNYMYGCKGVKITEDGHSYFCLKMSSEFTRYPVHFVERKFHPFNYCCNAF